MVTHDLDLEGVTVLPPEADPPLSVDADAELTRAIAGESFQAIARQSAEIVQAAGTPKDSGAASPPARENRRTAAPACLARARVCPCRRNFCSHDKIRRRAV
jgi:hypothetical protein